jgi:hypothetical protein
VAPALNVLSSLGADNDVDDKADPLVFARHAGSSEHSTNPHKTVVAPRMRCTHGVLRIVDEGVDGDAAAADADDDIALQLFFCCPRSKHIQTKSRQFFFFPIFDSIAHARRNKKKAKPGKRMEKRMIRVIKSL